MIHITLKDVSKYYINRKYKTALAALYHITCDIYPKEFTVIMGPSGCGKTTLLKVIAGIDDLDEGTILYNDIDVSSLPVQKRELSFVGSANTLYPNMTVFDNLAYPLKLLKVPIQEIKERVLKLAQEMNVEFLLSRKPKHLSGGQQQIISLLKALIKKPVLLLLDEPLSQVDPTGSTTYKNLLRHIHQTYQINIIMTTHWVNDAYELGDRFILMDNGAISKIINHREELLNDAKEE